VRVRLFRKVSPCPAKKLRAARWCSIRPLRRGWLAWLNATCHAESSAAAAERHASMRADGRSRRCRLDALRRWMSATRYARAVRVAYHRVAARSRLSIIKATLAAWLYYRKSVLELGSSCKRFIAQRHAATLRTFFTAWNTEQCVERREASLVSGAERRLGSFVARRVLRYWLGVARGMHVDRRVKREYLSRRRCRALTGAMTTWRQWKRNGTRMGNQDAKARRHFTRRMVSRAWNLWREAAATEKRHDVAVSRARARNYRLTVRDGFHAWVAVVVSVANTTLRLESLFHRRGGQRLRSAAFFAWRRREIHALAALAADERAHILMARHVMRPWHRHVAALKSSAATADSLQVCRQRDAAARVVLSLQTHAMARRVCAANGRAMRSRRHRHILKLTFQAWRRHWLSAASLRRRVRVASGRFSSGRVFRALGVWRRHVDLGRWRQHALRAVYARWSLRIYAEAFGAWRDVVGLWSRQRLGAASLKTRNTRRLVVKTLLAWEATTSSAARNRRKVMKSRHMREVRLQHRALRAWQERVVALVTFAVALRRTTSGVRAASLVRLVSGVVCAWRAACAAAQAARQLALDLVTAQRVSSLYRCEAKRRRATRRLALSTWADTARRSKAYIVFTSRADAYRSRTVLKRTVSAWWMRSRQSLRRVAAMRRAVHCRNVRLRSHVMKAWMEAARVAAKAVAATTDAADAAAAAEAAALVVEEAAEDEEFRGSACAERHHRRRALAKRFGGWRTSAREYAVHAAAMERAVDFDALKILR